MFIKINFEGTFLWMCSLIQTMLIEVTSSDFHDCTQSCFPLCLWPSWCWLPDGPPPFQIHGLCELWSYGLETLLILARYDLTIAVPPLTDSSQTTFAYIWWLWLVRKWLNAPCIICLFLRIASFGPQHIHILSCPFAALSCIQIALIWQQRTEGIFQDLYSRILALLKVSSEKGRDFFSRTCTPKY